MPPRSIPSSFTDRWTDDLLSFESGYAIEVPKRNPMNARLPPSAIHVRMTWVISVGKRKLGNAGAFTAAPRAAELKSDIERI
jgi:hypothetical protein